MIIDQLLLLGSIRSVAPCLDMTVVTLLGGLGKQVESAVGVEGGSGKEMMSDDIVSVNFPVVVGDAVEGATSFGVVY